MARKTNTVYRAGPYELTPAEQFTVTCVLCEHPVNVDTRCRFGHGYAPVVHSTPDNPLRRCMGHTTRYAADGSYLGRFNVGCWEPAA